MSNTYGSQRHPESVKQRGQFTALTTREIADRLGVSSQAVGEVEQRALYKIRNEIIRQMTTEGLTLSQWAGLD